MKTDYDPGADAVYITLRRGRVAYTEPLAGLGDSRLVDYAADGTPIGVDLMDVSARVDVNGLPEAAAIAAALKQAGVRVRQPAPAT